MAAKTAPANTKPLCPSMRLARSLPGEVASADSISPIDAAGMVAARASFVMQSAGADAWVEPRVHQVGGEGQPDIEHGHQEQHGLHHGKILPADRLPGELPDPLHREHRL